MLGLLPRGKAIQLFTNFSEYADAENPLADWSLEAQISNPSSDIYMSTGATGSLGGKYMISPDSAVSPSWQVWSWDEVTALAGGGDDAEILVKFQAPSAVIGTDLGFPPRLNVVTTTGNGYVLKPTSTTQYKIVKVTGGANTNGTDLETGIALGFTLASATWYWCRFRNDGGRLRSKVWEDGSTEPSAWQGDVTDGTPLTVGKPALDVNSWEGAYGKYYYDYYSVGLHGAPAI